MASLMSPHSWRKLGGAPCRQCGKAIGTSGEPGFCSIKCRLDMLADNRNKRDLRLQAEAKAEADRLAAARAAQRAADEEAERQEMIETEREQRIVEAIGVVCKVCKEGFNGTYDRSGWEPRAWAPEVCSLCTGLLRSYGAKGCHHEPGDEEPAIGTGRSFVLTRGGALHTIHGNLLSGDCDASEFDEPFDKALRAFVKVERQVESVSDTARKISGIGHDDVARSHRTASYRVPDTNPADWMDGSPWDSISAQLQKEVNAVLELLKLGSAGNHSPSQNLLGIIHLHGYGAPRFEAHGLSLMQHAVDAGNTSALHNMGRLHLLGHGAVHPDKGRAARLFRRAANQGSVESQRVLGHLFHSGVGVMENLVTAVHYWELAASAGDADAQYHLGLMCSIGKGAHQDDAKAMELWLSAAHGGSAEAEFHLGSLHERGRHGVHKDDHQAWLLYKAAAEKGHGMAQYHAGVMCLEGRGADGVPNDPKAVEYFELAAENGLSRAQFNLGILMLEGRGGGIREASDSPEALDAADQRARELFAEAAKQGLGEAQCSLAWMYVNSRGVRMDPSLTLPQREAARARDEAKALELYRAAAEQGIAEALFHLGLMYFRGVGVEKDEPVGMEYVMQAAFKGHSEAQYELGLMRVLLGRSGANRETAKRRPVPNKMGDYDGDADGYDDHSRRPPPPPPPPGSPRGGRGSPTDDFDDISPDVVLDETAADEQAGEEAEFAKEEEELKAEEEDDEENYNSDEEDEEDEDEDEDAEPIEDWLNTIQDSYGDKYNGIFRSSGYETREKLERDCGDEDVVDELLEKLESAGAKRPQIRRIREALEKLSEGSEGESEATSLTGSLGYGSKLSKASSSKAGSKAGSTLGDKYSKKGAKGGKKAAGESGSVSKGGKSPGKTASQLSSYQEPKKPTFDPQKYQKKKPKKVV